MFSWVVTTLIKAPAQSYRFQRYGLTIAYFSLGMNFTLQAQTNYTAGYQPHDRSETPGSILYRAPTPELGGRLTNIIYHQGWLMVGYENPGSDANRNDLRFRVMDISNFENDPTPVPFWPSDFGLDYGVNNHGREHWFTGNWGYNTHGHGRTAYSLHWSTLHVDIFGGAVEKGLHPSEQFNWGWGDAPVGGRLRRHLPWMGSQDWAYGDDGAVIHFGKAWRDDPNSGYQPSNYTRKSLGRTADGNFGVRGFPALMGDRFFVISDQRRSGVAIYKAPDTLLENYDPNAPIPEMTLLGLNKDPFGGYWPEFYGRNGRLYIVSGNSDNIQVMDVTDSSNPTLVRDWEPSVNGVPYKFRNATYPKFQDNLFMADGLVINMDLLISGHPNPVELVLEEAATGESDFSQFSMPLGNLIASGGYGADAGGLTIHVRQQAKDTTRPQVGFHVPEVNRSGYSRHMPVSVLIHEEIDSRSLHNGTNFSIRQVVDNSPSGEPIDCIVNLGSDNLLMLTPTAPLLANATYQVDFPETNGIMDISGNSIEPYSWRFSTGDSVDTNNDPAPSVSDFDNNSLRYAPNQTVTLNAILEDNEAFEYRFDPGNGSGFGGWVQSPAGSSAIELTHTYNEAGRFTAQLQVRDNQASYTTAALNLLILDPPAGTMPTESSPIILTSTGTIWAVNPDADTVTALDGSDGSKLGEYAVGNDPRNIAEDANGQLWVTCMKSDEVYILNPNGSIQEILTLDYGDAPFGVVASPDGATTYVTAYGSGLLYQFDVSNKMNPHAVPLGPTPRAIAVNGAHSKVFVTRFISDEYFGEVWRVDPSTHSVKSIQIHIVTDPDGNNSSAGVPNYLAGIALSPRGQYAVITGKKDNTFRGPIFGSAAPNHENSVRAMMATIDVDAETLVSDAYYDFDNSDSPNGVRFSPYGDILFVALQGNNEIFALDALDLGVTRTATRIPLQQSTAATDGSGGRAPQGLVIAPSTNRVFSQNLMSRSVTVFDATRALSSAEFLLPRLNEVSKVSNEGLSAEVRLGKEIFYNANDPRMGAETYMSCATCHVDGGHDGRVWDFSHAGEGLRRTTDLRGRSGTEQGSVHWSGNFDEIQDFEIVMRDRFLGDGFIEEANYSSNAGPSATLSGLSTELDALAAYVASLGNESVPRSPHRDPDTGEMTEAALRGREAFIALNCMSCHDGAKLTDSAHANLREVGTLSTLSGNRLGASLTGIDVPTLVGLHASERYGHMGVDESLEDFLSAAMGSYYEAEDADQMNGQLVTKREPESGGGSGYNWDIYGAHQNAIVNVGDSSTIRYDGVDGGSGGPGLLWVRSAASKWARGSDYEVSALINGNEVRISYPKQLSVDGTRLVGLKWRRVGIELLAGPNNTIELRRGGGRDMGIDAIMVANADDLALASVHRKIPEEQLGDIVAFLKQIDGRSDNLPPDYAAKSWRVREFTDTIENGLVSGWSADPDQDGIANQLEFLQGFDPWQANRGSEIPSIIMGLGNQNPAYHFRMREEIGDMPYRVQYSRNLTQWFDVEASAFEWIDTVNGIHRYRIPIGSSETNVFYRLLAE